MQNYAAKNVDGYIESASEEARPKLKELQSLIRSTLPEAEEVIAWGTPIYKYHGLLGGFSALKNHISFGLAAPLQDDDRGALEAEGYKTGKKTIQIKFDQKLPAAAIRRLLKAQAKRNKAEKAKK